MEKCTKLQWLHSSKPIKSLPLPLHTHTHTRVYRTSSLCQTSTPHHPCRCSVAETPWELAKTFVGCNTGLAATPLSKRPNIKQRFSHLFSTDYPANMVANSYNNSTEACTAHTLPYGPQLAKLANHNGQGGAPCSHLQRMLVNGEAFPLAFEKANPHSAVVALSSLGDRHHGDSTCTRKPSLRY